MFKHTTTVLGFTLATLLAGPALAQNNPSIEGYDGGNVQAETALHTVESTPLEASYTAGRLAANPSLEGYSGGELPSGKPQFATASEPRTQFADNPAGIRDDSPRSAVEANADGFTWNTEQLSTYGR
ncbi:hypothetical protein ACFOW6_15775 [Fodinicurvata halophila]|uniref:Uncharacterized protein n=1 Tax=Fodinicurvata halophila TaxID=1419723 RepID=A0ABV8UPJ0_9PROT